MNFTERKWILITCVWVFALSGGMIYWHFYGKLNLSGISQKINREEFLAKTQAMVNQYTVRMDTTHQTPVVHPPEGSDIYLTARLWKWSPILELEEGKTYTLHLAALDYIHGFSLPSENINVQLVPGYEHVIKIKPRSADNLKIICNEYCGLGHHTMVGEIIVLPNPEIKPEEKIETKTKIKAESKP